MSKERRKYLAEIIKLCENIIPNNCDVRYGFLGDINYFELSDKKYFHVSIKETEYGNSFIQKQYDKYKTLLNLLNDYSSYKMAVFIQDYEEGILRFGIALYGDNKVLEYNEGQLVCLYLE